MDLSGSLLLVCPLQMNAFGICDVLMVLVHPLLYHFSGKARWYLALSVMKKTS